MKKQGGYIPGIRPGKATVDYLNSILTYIIFIGAVGLCIVAVIPIFFNGYFGANVSFGGTSIIIYRWCSIRDNETGLNPDISTSVYRIFNRIIFEFFIENLCC